MELGIGYIVCKATCDICNNKWTGVVEVEYIQLEEKYKEYKIPERLECHNCLNYTTNFEVIEIQREEAIKVNGSFFKETKKTQREVLRRFILWAIKHYFKTYNQNAK
jgi:transcriptional regulator NrdR family protein